MDAFAAIYGVWGRAVKHLTGNPVEWVGIVGASDEQSFVIAGSEAP
ncbi:hypothetical protein [uncultured Bradyrhizobium sp.]